MKFKTPYTYKTNQGQKFKMTQPEYGYVKNEDTGKEELAYTGETDTYAMIQAGLEASDINNILKTNLKTIDQVIKETRVETTEEISDYTKVPKSFLDGFKQQEEAKKKELEATKKLEELKIKETKELAKFKKQQHDQQQLEKQKEKPKGEKNE